MPQWWYPRLCCRRRLPTDDYLDLDGMSEETFANWRRFGKKFRHIQKLGRYMAYIGHYLNMLRIIGERPSRAELARMHRERFRRPLPSERPPEVEVTPVAASPAPRTDPEPEPQ